MVCGGESWTLTEPVQREKCVAVNEAERSWRFEEHLDMRHVGAEIGVNHAGFRSCFCLIFPHYVLFPLFWNSSVYIVTLYIGNA